MKRLLLFLFIITCSQLSAQVFQAITEQTSKEFAPNETTWYKSYSLHIDSATQAGDTVVYHLANVINYGDNSTFQPNNDDPYECDGWGGCFNNSGTVGFGSIIQNTESGTLNFYTSLSDTLKFVFTESDSTVFFQSEDEFFAIVPQGESIQDVFGNDETVQSYRIGHYSSEGDAIDSPLHNYKITIGDQTGLIDFFFIDSFPEAELPLRLIGDQSLQSSRKVLLSEEIYNFEPGDTLQYKITHSEIEPELPPEPNIAYSYETRIFLSKTVEQDSLRYEVLQQTFSENANTVNEDTTELVYPRFDTIASLPFNSMLDNGLYNYSYHEYLSRRDICGQPRLQFLRFSFPANNCLAYDAWCYWDTDGPPPARDYIFVEGLGLYFDDYYRNGLGAVTSWSHKREIIYFSKSGVSCGNQAVLSTSDIDIHSNLKIFPNPAQDLVNIHADINTPLNGATIHILDSSGRLIFSEPFKNNEQQVDVSALNPGFYLVQTVSGNKLFGTTKLIVK